MTRQAETPHYIAEPPPAIAVDDGRSLFVDDFLISNISSGVQHEYMQASYIAANPVMAPTEPWEKRNMTYARAYSGGVWWISEEQQFKMWYGCGTSPATDSCIGLCLATSQDGVKWAKKPLDVVPGTNIVIDAVLKSNNVWLDLDDANASRRYKLSDSGGGGPGYPTGLASSYRLWSSADGVHWHVERDYTGLTSDRSTLFPNPLRTPRRWTFSIKNYQKATLETFGRSRLYWETLGDDLFTASWADNEPVNWQAAEELDPGYVAGPNEGQPAQLYNLDAFAYEGIIIGYFSIFRCKHNMKGCPVHPEFDSIYIGFSRDGYSWTKPPAGMPLPFLGVELSPAKRGPFLSMAPTQKVGTDPDPASKQWNYGAVQSVTGGIVLPNDNASVSMMLTYAGGQAGYGTMGISPGCTVGAAQLRRDGFAKMVARGAVAGTLLTRPLTWSPVKTHLFLNCAGGIAVEILQAGVLLRKSLVVSANSTRVEVEWAAPHSGAVLPTATAANPVQLRFTLQPDAALYSFWPATSKCGASEGVVAGGGPGFASSRDKHGSCGHRAKTDDRDSGRPPPPPFKPEMPCGTDSGRRHCHSAAPPIFLE